MSRDTEPEMTPERSEAIRDMLLQRVRDEPEFRRRRTRQRVVVGSLAGAVFMGAFATGAAVIVNARAVSDQTIVRCLTSDKPDADGVLPGSSAMVSSGSRVELIHDARALCSELWAQGMLTPSPDATAASHAPVTVPKHLQVCVQDDGSAVVVPSDSKEICQDLGFAPADSE